MLRGIPRIAEKSGFRKIRPGRNRNTKRNAHRRVTQETIGRRYWATTRSVSPRRPQGRQQTKQRCKYVSTLLAVAVRQYYIACTAKWRRFMAFLEATKRRYWASPRSDSINRTCLPLISGVYFIVKSLKKGSSCPNNNTGMTHQSDVKHT